MKMIVLCFLFLSPSLVMAEIPPALYDKAVASFNYEDGCIVSNALDNPKVLNPKECPDKELVAFLNCNDKFLKPTDARPEECVGVKEPPTPEEFQ